jgi:DNA-binding NarL/FixJ family response regulator
VEEKIPLTTETTPDTSTPPPVRKRRVVLVDDHPIVRDGLVQMISRHEDLTVCGEAGTAEEAMRVIEELKPDLAIVDIFLDGINGIELTKMLHDRDPSLPILILSMHDESLYAERAIRAGAMGYVMKQEASRTILDAIRTVLEGKRYVSSHVGEMLGEQPMDAKEADLSEVVDRLSPRELGIFELIGAGKDRTDISAELKISIKTVETHRANIKYKLNARSAPELVQCAKRWVESKK